MVDDSTFSSVGMPPQMLEAIGHVVVQWSSLEWAVQEAIWLLGGFSNSIPAQIVTAEMMINQRMDVLMALSQAVLYGPPPGNDVHDELVRINKLVRDGENGGKSLQAQRNRIVHTYWAGMDSSDRAFTAYVKAKKKLDFGLKPVSRDEVMATAKAISKVVMDVNVVANNIRALKLEWPEGTRL